MTLTALPFHSFPATDEPSVILFPAQPECTVAQAADILGMSEGCVNELLDDDVIEYRQNGDKRMIQRDSLLEFSEDYREGREVMTEITRMAQEMGLYD